MSGMFEDEAILGSFLSKFILILLSILPFKNFIKFESYLNISIFILLISTIFISGERIAFVYSIFL